jgi:hypothetical protein
MTVALARVGATRLAVAGALVVFLVLAAPIIARQWTIARYEAWALRDLGGAPPSPWLTRPVPVCAADCPPAVLTASAVSLIAQSDGQSGGLATPALRRTAYHDAERRLGAALNRQPASGSGWNWLAYARLKAGRPMTEVCAALARSYDAAPFLVDEGPWRTRVAALNWPLLSPHTRVQVVNEAVWLHDVDAPAYAAVAQAFIDTDAVGALAAGLSRPPSVLVPHRWSRAPGGVGAAH